MIRRIAAFVGAVLTAYVIGSFASTQMVLNSVAALGMPVGFRTRASATLHDLLGMAPAYGAVIAVAFLIALPVAALAMRFVPGPRLFGYVLACGVAITAVHLIMSAVLGMHPLPATRTATGLALQAAAGAAGGYVFARLRAARSAAE